MASLFDAIGNGISGLFGEGFGDRAARAIAIGNGDAGTAAAITQNMRKRKQEEAAMQQISAVIDSDPTLASPQDKAYAMANPEEYIKAYMTRFESRQYGPGGGSLMTPGQQPIMAPSRVEHNGGVTDVGGGPMGQQAQVVQQHQGAPQLPGIADEANWYNSLPPDQRAKADSYMQKRYPAQSAPVTIPYGAQVEAGGQSGGGSPGPAVTAVNPKTGERIRFNPQNNAWEPMGGQTGAPSGGFPGL